MKNRTVYMLLLIGMSMSGGMYSCEKRQGKPEQVSDADSMYIVGKQSFQAERDTLAMKMTRMKQEIQLQIDEIDSKLSTADDVARTKLQKTKEELQHQQQMLQKGLDELSVATSDTWGEIKGETNELMNSVKSSFDKAMFEIKDLFNDKT